MSFFLLKSLHIIFVITWFAGLFYIVRLFIYHREAQDLPNNEREVLTRQFKIMEKRLWFAITWPSAVLTFVLGPTLALYFWPLHSHPWLLTKFLLVAVLAFYHFSCHILFQQMRQDIYKYSSQQLRLWNEVPTLLLFMIVFLVVFKSLFSPLYAVILLAALIVSILGGIKIYKKFRN